MARGQYREFGSLIRSPRSTRGLLMSAILLAVGLLFANKASAEVFQSRFLRFSLPEGWKCDQEGSEFVCMPPHPKGKKVSMIFVLAAKYPGDIDNLPSYMEELKKNKSKTGESSLVDGPKIDDNIGGVSWVEATHIGSEIEGFYTIYMATVTDGLAVLVTFSVHKDQYQQFKELVRPCIESLEVKKGWRNQQSAPTKK
jgi:hypothetical protein